MVLRCACFARLKAPTKFSFKNFKADTELKTTIMDHRSVAFHPARNLRQAATKERLTTKEASTNGSCSLHFVELSHCFLLFFFFPILSWQTLRILHGRAEIRNFSSSVEKYFTRLLRSIVKYFQHEKRNFVSPSGHVMFYLLYKHQWNTKPFQWNGFFPAKGAIYYVAIEDIMFSRESSPGISLVFI